jgi:hypothetical protein
LPVFLPSFLSFAALLVQDSGHNIASNKKPAAHGHGLNYPVLWQLGCHLGIRGFPSLDCSWFGFFNQIDTYILISNRKKFQGVFIAE